LEAAFGNLENLWCIPETTVRYVLILTHLGEPLERPPLSPARGPPTECAEFVQAHHDRDIFQSSPDGLLVIDIRSL
jgi:hypothetical protein